MRSMPACVNVLSIGLFFALVGGIAMRNVGGWRGEGVRPVRERGHLMSLSRVREQGAKILSSSTLSERYSALAALLQSIEGDDIGAVLVHLRGRDEPLLADAIEDVWAEKDPISAYAFAAANPLTNGSFLHKILKSWAQLDPGAAFDAAVEIGHTGETRRRAEDFAFSGSRTADLKALREDYNRPNYLKTVLAEAVSMGCEAALSHIDRLRAPDAKRKAVAALGELWANESWPAAKEWANSLASQDLRDSALSAVLAERARLEPGESRDLIEQMSDTPEMLLRKESIAKTWAKNDPMAAYSWIVENESGEGAIRLLEVSMEGGDPAESARFLVENHAYGSAGLFVDTVSHWSASEPTSALAWANAVDGSLRGPAIGAAIEGWASTDVATAKSYVEDLPQSDPFARQAVAAIARAEGKTNAAGALTWLSDHADAAGKAFGPVSMDLVNNAASENPRLAADLIESFPDSLPGQLRFREVAVDAIVRQWGQVDRDGLYQWAQELPPSSQHADMVFASITSMVEQSDPSAADNWSGKIRNAEYRRKRSFGL